MNCPSCNSQLEQNARFCGVCGYRLEPSRPAAPPGAGSGLPAGTASARANDRSAVARAGAAEGVAKKLNAAAASAPAGGVAPIKASPAQAPGAAAKKPKPKGDEIYLNQVLNNRFKVESKIGEGGFGAVYRGVQLATGRKVALKLLHPEMTKDENLVARFRREGMVLCNLRDAHTITTYDFDQTPDGTLYIAMELLEGKSLHQLFHEQAPLEWRRMFKILSEMCSSLAEAHAQGIVHRDLKPENVYLETRPGNPEFVKILDFGIAKVMRGDTIDPQSPQLTATGQTLGTLEYMSPEQLMGKQLDGRSDVYALGVVAYEMITGRLPFPDAKGPAGLITAQLKQTPVPPSAANPKVQLPVAADRVILKCLEKDKNNRYPDVTQLSNALQEVIAQASAEQAMLAAGASGERMLPRGSGSDLDGRRADGALAPMPVMASPSPAPAVAASSVLPPPPMPIPHSGGPGAVVGHGGAHVQGHAPGAGPQGHRQMPLTPAPGVPLTPPPGSIPMTPPPGMLTPPPIVHAGGSPYPQGMSPPGGAMVPHNPFPQATPYPHPQGHYPAPMQRRSMSWLWWVAGLLVLGAGVGALAAVLLR